MIVRPINDYIEKKGTNIPTKALDHLKSYEVIIERRDILGNKSFFLIDDMFLQFPTEWPSKLFEIEDYEKEGWEMSRRVKGFAGTIACKAELMQLLKDDERFFEHLVDGETGAQDKFRQIFPGTIE